MTKGSLSPRRCRCHFEPTSRPFQTRPSKMLPAGSDPHLRWAEPINRRVRTVRVGRGSPCGARPPGRRRPPQDGSPRRATLGALRRAWRRRAWSGCCLGTCAIDRVLAGTLPRPCDVLVHDASDGSTAPGSCAARRSSAAIAASDCGHQPRHGLDVAARSSVKHGPDRAGRKTRTAQNEARVRGPVDPRTRSGQPRLYLDWPSPQRPQRGGHRPRAHLSPQRLPGPHEKRKCRPAWTRESAFPRRPLG
jgi:hypothetical protein